MPLQFCGPEPAKFIKQLQQREDHRFCDFNNLFRKSFNVLKKVKRLHNMDSIHIVSLIERKMTPDDRKVWSRHMYVREWSRHCSIY